MANAYAQDKQVDTTRRTVIVATGLMDNSGQVIETVDVSGLKYALNTNGQIMSANANIKSQYRVTIERMAWDTSSMPAGSRLEIWWSGNSSNSLGNTLAWVIGGGYAGSIRFREDFDFVLKNPNEGNANSPGDVLIKSVGVTVANTAYSLMLDLRKNEADYDQGQTVRPTDFNR